ncbi:MAG: hypothetical protein JNK85_18280 [Verrucomicrobiales bacterium]|nr:hypothetical protein [Verrucomicrobiales bacterium]
MRGPLACINLVLALFVAASASAGPDPAPTLHAARKPKAVKRFRVHVESKHDIPERSLIVELGKPNPVKFTAEKLPILNEVHVTKAALLDEIGGFKVQISFNTLGAKILESYTAAAAGRHLLIMTEIDGEARWLGAPLIRRRLGDGVLEFVPNATREDMERMVSGLNKEVRKNKSLLLD